MARVPRSQAVSHRLSQIQKFPLRGQRFPCLPHAFRFPRPRTIIAEAVEGLRALAQLMPVPAQRLQIGNFANSQLTKLVNIGLKNRHSRI